MVSGEVVKSIKRYLEVLREKGIPARYAVLFGSYARKEEDKWSDIDLIVISPKFDMQYKEEDVLKLWSLAGQTDSRIEPIACGEQEWEKDDTRLIIEVARREGIKIAA